jgi:stearoyl-CoA desaturase (delta-9 desaturase)
MNSVFHFPNLAYLAGHHLLALYAIYNLPSVISVRLVVELLLATQLSGLFGITAGAHRLWSHRFFEAAFPVRLVFMCANSTAHQGSIYHWVRDHRMHHRYTDTELDPHSIQYGFWYSHIGWLFFKKNQQLRDAARTIDMSDIEKDPIVMFQKRYYSLLSNLFCFGLPALYGYSVWNSWWIGYFYFGVLRWILLLHATWCVNSVAHLWGTTPYNPSHSSRQNAFTSIVAVGEGWHNYHHRYPYDYRASEFGWVTHWNPTSLVLDGLGLLGLVWNQKVGIPPRQVQT